MNIEKMMDNHLRKLKIMVTKEIFSPTPAMPMLMGVGMIWAPKLMLSQILHDPEFSDAKLAWLDSNEFLYALIALSVVALLIASTKSLFTAVLLWIAGVAAIISGADSEIAYGLLLSAFLSSCIFKFSYRG